MKGFYLIVFLFLFQVLSYSQTTKNVQEPKFGTSPGTTEYYFNSALNNPVPKTPTHPSYSTPMGATADDIINQTYSRVQGPVYRPGATPQENQQANIQYIKQQMANDPAYQMPNASNGFNNLAMQRNKELMTILNEVHSKEPSFSEYWKEPGFAAKENPYYNALNKIKDQLTGKAPLSVADAYFEVENAEGNTMLNRNEFKAEINKTASFAKRWMLENKLDLGNNLSVHFTIQKLLSDTLKIGKKVIEIPDVRPQIHLPVYYDYEDYKAEKDYRSYHVSKGFATGNGQCHVLPLMYSCIAEAMGAKFYLSYAPFHSFIQYPDNKGNIHGYEVTTNWQINDQWYKENLNVTSIAEKNKIYLHPMNRKEIVAAAMIDLACSYRRNNGLADGKFINECIDFAMNYFPNKEANIYGWLLRSKLTAAELDRFLVKKGIKDLNDIEQNPEAQQLLAKLNNINKKIESLGYTEVDEGTYDQMIQDSKARHPEIPQKGNLQKRNLFIPLATKTK